MTTKTGNNENAETRLTALPGNHSRNKGRPGSYGDCRQALRKLHSVPVYAKVRDERGKYLLGHRRGHTRPFTVTAYAGCPFIRGLS